MPADLRLFDGVLALAILWVGWRALASGELFRSVVQFMVFGLLVSLAWVRLGAPDVALAEAAVGAGLAGALLLDTLARLGPSGSADEPRPLRLTLPRRAIALGCAGLGFALAASVAALPPQWTGLSGVASDQLPNSGVSNPVTATLLNYRGYDTLLEIAVLLLALLGTWILGPEAAAPPRPEQPMLSVLLRVLLPVALVLAGYLLWVGAHAPGGGFQAAAVLAAAGVLWHVARPLSLAPSWGLRVAAVFGFAVFLVAATAMVPLAGGFLRFPPPQAGLLILGIEAAAMLSIAVIMSALFAGQEGSRR